MKNLLKKSLIVFLFGLNAFFSNAQAPAIISEGLDQVSILTWNIFMLPVSFFPKSGQLERAEGIVEQLKDQAYDIIVFQEAFDKKAREILWEGLKEKFPFTTGPDKGGFMKLNNGVWILSKFKFTTIASIKFNTCKVADCFSKKGATLVEFIKDGKFFQVIGTHLQSENYQEVRNEQFEEITEHLLKPYEKEGVPQIIAGDLNTPVDDEESYSNMLCILNAEDQLPEEPKIMKKKELVTWGGFNNDLFEEGNNRIPQLLDYILVKHNGSQPKWIKKSIKVIQQAWNSDRKKKDLSDHYAVAAIIKY